MWDLMLAPLNWIEARPAVIAWLIGWLAAIAAGQIVKYQVPLEWDHRQIQRIVQLVAVFVGALATFALWPQAELTRRLTFALVVGMSAPMAYVAIKGVVRWKFPALANRVTVTAIRSARLAKQDEIPPPP